MNERIRDMLEQPVFDRLRIEILNPLDATTQGSGEWRKFLKGD